MKNNVANVIGIVAKMKSNVTETPKNAANAIGIVTQMKRNVAEPLRKAADLFRNVAELSSNASDAVKFFFMSFVIRRLVLINQSGGKMLYRSITARLFVTVSVLLRFVTELSKRTTERVAVSATI